VAGGGGGRREGGGKGGGRKGKRGGWGGGGWWLEDDLIPGGFAVTAVGGAMARGTPTGAGLPWMKLSTVLRRSLTRNHGGKKRGNMSGRFI